MTKAPKVTVFMPVYNGEKYLKEAIESILVQTFPDFELLIIDDGSTDGSAAVVKLFKDTRIRFIQNERNMSLPYTRNRGFELAHGEYIAFMDCDDVSAPDRLQKQVAFMEANPEVGICGSWVQDITTAGQVIEGQVRIYPAEDKKIRHMLLWAPPLWNPSLILRRRVIMEHNLFHNPLYKIGEDYDLWVRASKVTQLANLPEILHYYRRHDYQISTRRSVEAVWNVCNLQLGLLFDLIKQYLPKEELGSLEKDLANPKLLTQNIVQVDRLVEKIKEENILTGPLSQETLEKSHQDLWYKFLSGLPRFDLKLYQAIRQSSFFRSLSYSVRLKLWLKCLVGMQQEWIMQLNSLKSSLKDRKIAWQ